MGILCGRFNKNDATDILKIIHKNFLEVNIKDYPKEERNKTNVYTNKS